VKNEKWGHFPYSPKKEFGKRLGVIMRRFKFLLSAILYTVVLFLHIPAVIEKMGTVHIFSL